ncbi:MAG: pantetheine-phosphate adenylyltransferase, partial [Promethearchaeia archaeon]
FDHFHKGHQLLIETGLKISEKLVIGLSTEELLKNKEYREHLESYNVRKKHLTQFLKKHSSLDKTEICELNDPFGPPAREPEYEAIVVSQETYEEALKVNTLRIEKGFKPLVIIVIPILKDTSNRKISSTDFRKESKF